MFVVALSSGCGPILFDDDGAGESVHGDASIEDKVSGCRGRCSPACPCEEGEGDCDVDADCKGSLVCPPDRQGAEQCEAPPSCEGRCSGACPCEQGEGDCDTNADCAGDLVCPPDAPGKEVCEAPPPPADDDGSGDTGDDDGGNASDVANCVAVPEGGAASLSCDGDGTIASIDFASYGTPDGSCGTSLQPSACHAESSMELVKDACLGEAACTVEARNALFRDPCPGTRKSLAIVYSCSGGAEPGLVRTYYAGQFSVLPDFTQLTPLQSESTTEINVGPYAGTEQFALLFTGDLLIETPGTYEFEIGSDDGSRLLIDGRSVVNNDGLHGFRTRTGSVALDAGRHAIRVEFFERSGGERLRLRYRTAGGSFAEVPPQLLSHRGGGSSGGSDDGGDGGGEPDDCGDPSGNCEGSEISLPIEVLGVEGTTAQRVVQLSDAQARAATSLWLQVNNLSYENKASVRINGGSWLSLNHDTVDMPAKERGYGGMAHGGLSTIRFTIPARGLRRGSNTVRFRFDRSDAISMGFRVVRMQLLDGAGRELLAASTFVDDDPDLWQPPHNDEASISEGERLWREAALWSHYLPNGRKGFWYSESIPSRRPIRATCADCHTQDGRDLELFAYSNHSIIERAKFHGLSDEQGELIASYIRSLSSRHEDVSRPGRPWNPPFQPGPEVANLPVSQWAAGAGLDAVLESDDDMLADMFTGTPTQQTVDRYFDSSEMWDTSTQRVSIQLPDWKRWLPLAHPLDAFGRNGWIDSNIAYHPVRGYEALRAFFEDNQFPYGGLRGITGRIRSFYRNYRLFFEQGGSETRHWRTRDGDAVTRGLQSGVPVELAKTSLARLLAVKFFEVHHEFALHDKAPQLIAAADQPRARQWLGKQTQVFSVPPHFTACEINKDCLAFLGQDEAVGVYESTAWYQLQQVINPGMGMINETSPVDYNYVPRFILLSSDRSGLAEPLRFYYSSNVMYQTRTWSGADSPNHGRGFNIRVMGPWMFYGTDDTHAHHGMGFGGMPRLLDGMKPGLGAWVVEAQLRQFVEAVNEPANDLARWNRQGDPGAKRSYALEPENTPNSDMPNLSRTFRPAFNNYAQKIYWTLPKFVDLGVDCAVLGDVVDWAERAWPRVNWQATLNGCR